MGWVRVEQRRRGEFTMQLSFGGNEQVRCDEIWKIATRNNKKPVTRIYRINGERVSQTEFNKFKGK